MEAEKKSCSITIKDDHDDHKDSSEEQELSLSIEKLNLVVPKKKKLLVMNLNGFLLHRFIHRHILRDGRYVPNPILGSRRADSISGNFLRKHNIDGALDLAIGEESKNKLLFVWNQDQCRQTNTASKESNEKPIYFKELQKVWEKVEKGGPYSASNTLMIGDKPYKAYLNPENTAIFAKSYDPEDKEDNALDPNGELCEYLKGVAEAEDVQSYVKNNEFGIPEITEDNSEWFFYFRVLFGELMV
ncbi:unnamed protein product [Trifolium pratense]|uniref:Uncharacterized protein n=1 Tax=Trifolium pratense TaxID=57577 RepID=A0ACB0IKC4_TRIPR|nr:unnamed protein product [Trifolium pratense]